MDTKVSTLVNPVSFIVWRRPETGDRFEKRIRQRIFPVVRTDHLWGSVLFFYLFAVQLLYCYTYGSVYAECGITVPHDSLARYNRQHPRR